MKRIIALVLTLVLALSLAACGKSEEEKAAELAVANVESLINEIGTVTTESGDAITKAERKYNSLSSDEQKQVSNYGALQKAKDDYKDAVTDFIIGRWEYTNVAVSDSSFDDFSKGDTVKHTLVFFDGYSRLVMTNVSKNNVVYGDYTYSWVIENGLVKQKSNVNINDDVFSYEIDLKNKTLTRNNSIFYKVSDDPNYYLN